MISAQTLSKIFEFLFGFLVGLGLLDGRCVRRGLQRAEKLINLNNDCLIWATRNKNFIYQIEIAGACTVDGEFLRSIRSTEAGFLQFDSLSFFRSPKTTATGRPTIALWVGRLTRPKIDSPKPVYTLAAESVSQPGGCTNYPNISLASISNRNFRLSECFAICSSCGYKKKLLLCSMHCLSPKQKSRLSCLASASAPARVTRSAGHWSCSNKRGDWIVERQICFQFAPANRQALEFRFGSLWTLGSPMQTAIDFDLFAEQTPVKVQRWIRLLRAVRREANRKFGRRKAHAFLLVLLFYWTFFGFREKEKWSKYECGSVIVRTSASEERLRVLDQDSWCLCAKIFSKSDFYREAAFRYWSTAKKPKKDKPKVLSDSQRPLIDGELQNLPCIFRWLDATNRQVGSHDTPWCHAWFIECEPRKFLTRENLKRNLHTRRGSAWRIKKEVSINQLLIGPLNIIFGESQYEYHSLNRLLAQ